MDDVDDHPPMGDLFFYVAMYDYLAYRDEDFHKSYLCDEITRRIRHHGGKWDDDKDRWVYEGIVPGESIL